MLTGTILNSYRRRRLTSVELNAWAEQLVKDGHESDAILLTLGNSDLAWEKVDPCFSQICRDLGISQHIDSEVDKVTREVWLDEYDRGLRSGGELLHTFDDLRKEVGIPDQIILRFLEDNPDGTNDSGYYSWDHKLSGDALESFIRDHLARAGLIAASGWRLKQSTLLVAAMIVALALGVIVQMLRTR